MSIRYLSLFFCLISLSRYNFANEIAITFDDLPGAPDGMAAMHAFINQPIVNALLKFKAPVTGFVNEGKLYSSNEFDEKTALLKLWVDSGFDLGNHTYSHRSISSLSPSEYQSEVIEGEKISKSLMNNAGREYHYFRHPYFDTGTTPEIRSAFESFLQREGYLIAPITIDTNDWIFNQQLLEHPDEKDKIIQAYLAHTRAKFVFFEGATQQIFARNIKQIWILHVNLINAYTIESLLNIAESLDYHFISLEDALQDEAYHSADNYYSDDGVSWLYRWDFTGGKAVDWSQDPEPKIFFKVF